jgi:hypothetical protein
VGLVSSFFYYLCCLSDAGRFRADTRLPAARLPLPTLNPVPKAVNSLLLRDLLPVTPVLGERLSSNNTVSLLNSSSTASRLNNSSMVNPLSNSSTGSLLSSNSMDSLNNSNNTVSRPSSSNSSSTARLLLLPELEVRVTPETLVS